MKYLGRIKFQKRLWNYKRNNRWRYTNTRQGRMGRVFSS